MDEIIAVSGLKKSFRSRGRSVEAVRGISFGARPGEILGLLGPNGAGKTTTQRMLTTLLPIGEGKAMIAGFDVAREPARVRSKIGYVGQQSGSDNLMTGRENLLLQAGLYGMRRPSAASRVAELVGLLSLEAIADRPVRSYSGGQRRRLDLAMGLVHRPGLLFLDEPSTGLDPQSRANLWQQIRALRQQGTFVLLTTHYLDEADALCDRLMIVDHGLVVAEGSPQELKRQVLGDTVRLTLRDGGQLSQALELLGHLPSVRQVTREGAALLLYVEDGASALPELLRFLDQRGLPIATITLALPTLDDVFLAKTGRSLREAGPEEQVAA
jgi:ABC-2 type transport system ATP-binding protein